MLSYRNVAVLAHLNRRTLTDTATAEVATGGSTPTGGKVEDWNPVSDDHVNMPCRVSITSEPRERVAGSRATPEADYVVVFDHDNAQARTLGSGMRLRITSGCMTPAAAAYATLLYVLAVDAPQSLDPFPKVWCTSRPQPGQ